MFCTLTTIKQRTSVDSWRPQKPECLKWNVTAVQHAVETLKQSQQFNVDGATTGTGTGTGGGDSPERPPLSFLSAWRRATASEGMGTDGKENTVEQHHRSASHFLFALPVSFPVWSAQLFGVPVSFTAAFMACCEIFQHHLSGFIHVTASKSCSQRCATKKLPKTTHLKQTCLMKPWVFRRYNYSCPQAWLMINIFIKKQTQIKAWPRWRENLFPVPLFSLSALCALSALSRTGSV